MKYSDEKYMNLKINTYICRELYRLMGTNRDTKFRSSLEEGNIVSDKRKKYKSWGEIFNNIKIPEVRITRIISKRGNYKFTVDEAKIISTVFDIDSKYFLLKDTKLLRIPGVKIEDWKMFMSGKYGDINYVNVNKMKFDTSKDLIEKSLQKVIGDYTKGYLNQEDPLYKMCFYYDVGRTYENKDITISIKNKVEDVYRIEPKEWAYCNPEDIVEFIKKLTEKVNILNAYLIYKENFDK